MADITLKKLSGVPISVWLKRWAAGDRAASNALHQALAPYWLESAESLLRKQPGSELAPAELLTEAWLRLSIAQCKRFKNRRHFFGTVVRAMHFHLIDCYRAQQGTLPSARSDANNDWLIARELDTAEATQLISFRQALDALEHEHLRQYQHFVMMEILGMSLKQASALSVKPVITVRRDVDFAYAWLSQSLSENYGATATPQTALPKFPNAA